jgi:hypothetical protein
MPKDWKWSWNRHLRNPELWETFHEVLDPHGIPAVKCKACRQSFKHPGFYQNTFSTTAMSRHQSQCQRRRPSSYDHGHSDISKLFQKRVVGNEASDSLTENDVKDMVLDFFISGNIPFNQADNPEFQKLIDIIKVKGRQITINRKNLRARLTEQAAKAKQDLKDELAANTSRVSLAMDCWTSRLNNSYLGTSLVAYK